MDSKQIEFLEESIELYERKLSKAIYKHPYKYAKKIYEAELETINKKEGKDKAKKKR